MKLADRFKTHKPVENTGPEFDKWQEMVMQTAFVIRSETVHFDIEKFLNAAGVEPITARLLARRD